MKADTVIAAFKRFLEGDRQAGIQVIRQLEANESDKNPGVASRLRALLNSQAGQVLIQLPKCPSGLVVIEPRRTLGSLILEEPVLAKVRVILKQWENKEKLLEHNLPPITSILLSGPSGNGKTALAEALATSLKLPFASVAYERVIDSHMGNTGRALAEVLSFATQTPCVLFFDECDSITCARTGGSEAATKEIDRVVNQLLIKMDGFGHRSLLVMATNRGEVLDPALLRRIGVKLLIFGPDEKQKQTMVASLCRRWPFIADGAWIDKVPSLNSFAEIEALAMDVARERALEGYP